MSTFYPSPGGQTNRRLTEQQVRRIVQEELAKKAEPTPEATLTVTLTESEARELVRLLSVTIDSRVRAHVFPAVSLVAIRAKLETASADA